MDFFTHIVLSYFLNIGLDSPDFIFGIGGGILPDMDLLWSPLGKKYYWAKHRTVTHTIPFIIVLAVSCSLIASAFWPLEFWELLPFAFLTGMLHIATDLITTSGIPVLFPFSQREFKFELDKAINPYIMGLSFLTIIFLNSLGRIGYDYSLYKIWVAGICLALGIYYLYKFIRKMDMIKKYSSKEERINVLPTSGLFVWYLVNKTETGGEYRLKYGKINVIKDKAPKYTEFRFNKKTMARPPLKDVEQIKSFTYHLKEVQNYIKKFKYPVADIRKSKGAQNRWVVYWYPLELVMLDRTSALEITVSKNGSYSARRTFFINVNRNLAR